MAPVDWLKLRRQDNWLGNSPGCQPEALRLKSSPPSSLLKGLVPCPFSFEGAFNLLKNLMSAIKMVLYKRPFRKEKEVTTFLIKALKWNWAINLQLLSQMRRLNVQYSLRQQARYLSLLTLRVQELPILNQGKGRIEAFARLDFDCRASLIVKYGLQV